MYKVEKRFTIPIGHRLSKHAGRCHSFHGHNFTVLVGVKAKVLDKNDMVIDFANLSKIVNEYLDGFDHCTLLNIVDKDIAQQLTDMGSRVILMEHDPTAEKLSERIYKSIKSAFKSISVDFVEIDYVTVFENENSKATYTEE